MTVRPGGGEGGSPMTGPALRGALLEAVGLVEMEDTGGLARWTIDCCVTLLGADAAGLVELTGAEDQLSWNLTASHEGLRDLVEYDLHGADGPFRQCITSGDAVTIDDLSHAGIRWADFATSARRQGFTWLHGQPLRASDAVVGALLLLGTSDGGRPEGGDLQLAHALAALAAAGGAQRQVTRLRDVEVQQLQEALESRIVIEQAKGILASRHGLGLDRAFALMRRYARDHRKDIHAVADDVVHSRGLLDSVER
jgi:hypothetical protein